VIESGTGEAAGEQLDQKFDEAYEEVQTTMDRLVTHINKRVSADSAFLSKLSWSIIAIAVGTFALICALIFRLGFKNEKLIGENSAKLEEEKNRMDATAAFIEGVSSGNYTVELSGMSETEGLGATLVNMRNKLNQNAETDRRRNWATTGLAQIGDILRASNTTTTELYDNIIRFVVKYTESNQAGLFILNDEMEEDHYLELAACYAFERKKYLTRKVAIGEGLVGQCFVEGERIYLLDVPDEYISITSGLGGANPSALLLVPMKVNEKLYGVIELASFKKFEEYEIELVEKLAESIASTISTVRTNESTRILLEKTQQQTEEMRAQEEEMRQNMEELEATQEQTNRQMHEFTKVKKDIDVRESVFTLTTILSESDLSGAILMMNDKLCSVSKYDREELLSKPHSIFRHPDMPKQLFKIFWETIKSGQVFKGIIKNKAKDGSHYWVDATIVPVKDENGKIYKYIGACYHILNDRMALELYNQQAEKLNLPLL
jgi:PAS domain S-box-containing protein